MAKYRYKVVDGKHDTGEVTPAGEHVYVRKGETIVLDEAVAKRFAGKFELIPEPVKAVEEPKKEADGKTDGKTASATPAK